MRVPLFAILVTLSASLRLKTKALPSWSIQSPKDILKMIAHRTHKTFSANPKDDPNVSGTLKDIPDLFHFLSAGYNKGAWGPTTISAATLTTEDGSKQEVFVVSISGTELEDTNSYTGGVTGWGYTNLLASLLRDSDHVYNILWAIEDFFSMRRPDANKPETQLYIMGHSQGGMVAQQVGEILNGKLAGDEEAIARYQVYRDTKLPQWEATGLMEVKGPGFIKEFQGSVMKIVTMGAPEISRGFTDTTRVNCYGDPIGKASLPELARLAKAGLLALADTCLTCMMSKQTSGAAQLKGEDFVDVEPADDADGGEETFVKVAAEIAEDDLDFTNELVTIPPAGNDYNARYVYGPLERHTKCYTDRSNPFLTDVSKDRLDVLGVKGGSATLQIAKEDLNKRRFYSTPLNKNSRAVRILRAATQTIKKGANAGRSIIDLGWRVSELICSKVGLCEKETAVF